MKADASRKRSGRFQSGLTNGVFEKAKDRLFDARTSMAKFGCGFNRPIGRVAQFAAQRSFARRTTFAVGSGADASWSGRRRGRGASPIPPDEMFGSPRHERLGLSLGRLDKWRVPEIKPLDESNLR